MNFSISFSLDPSNKGIDNVVYEMTMKDLPLGKEVKIFENIRDWIDTYIQRYAIKKETKDV